MPWRSFFPATALLVLAPPAALGDSRPMFGVYRVAHPATDIVIVTEGTVIDGEVEVLESLKGDLQPGQTLHVPWLERWAAPERRKITVPNSELWEVAPEVNPYAAHVTGNRILLFLSERDGNWLPASEDTGIDELLSIAWIENQLVYAYARSDDTQPLRLRPNGKTEAGIKHEIDRYLLEYVPPKVAEPRPRQVSERASSPAYFLFQKMLGVLMLAAGICFLVCSLWKRDFHPYRQTSILAIETLGARATHTGFAILGGVLALAGLAKIAGFY